MAWGIQVENNGMTAEAGRGGVHMTIFANMEKTLQIPRSSISRASPPRLNESCAAQTVAVSMIPFCWGRWKSQMHLLRMLQSFAASSIAVMVVATYGDGEPTDSTVATFNSSSSSMCHVIVGEGELSWQYR